MLLEEEINKENIDSRKTNEPEIELIQINSFKYLFDLLKSDKYKIKTFSNDLKHFCIESEKYNYICEKIEEFKIIKDERNKNILFERFLLCKNRFDFQISMSDLLITFFKFLKNNNCMNKKEFNIIKNILHIFTEIKMNNLLMEDIQCLIEYGVLKDFNNSFYSLLFYINDRNVKDLLSFFNLKNYFLSNINQINIFISSFNELINSTPNETKLVIFVKKVEIIISEIVIILDDENENDENKHKLEIYKEKIITLINKDKIFELFFIDNMFISHLDILIKLFKIFPNEINKQINI